MDKSSSFVHWQCHLVSEAGGCPSESGQCHPSPPRLHSVEKSRYCEVTDVPHGLLPSHLMGGSASAVGDLCMWSPERLGLVSQVTCPEPHESQGQRHDSSTAPLTPGSEGWSPALSCFSFEPVKKSLPQWRQYFTAPSAGTLSQLSAVTGRSETLRARCDVTWAWCTLRRTCRIKRDHSWMPLLSAAGGFLNHLGLDFPGHQVRCSFWGQSSIWHVCWEPEAKYWNFTLFHKWGKPATERNWRETGSGKKPRVTSLCMLHASRAERQGRWLCSDGSSPPTGWTRSPAAFKPCP